MKNSKYRKASAVIILFIITIFSLFGSNPGLAIADNNSSDDDFYLAILSGFGYTLIIDNTKNDEDLVVNHTAFGRGIFAPHIVRNDMKNITIPSGSLLLKTVHPVFCFHPFVNITVTLSSGNKTLSRTGIQLFSKFHIFYEGPRYI
jgi:hypothetical protein